MFYDPNPGNTEEALLYTADNNVTPTTFPEAWWHKGPELKKYGGNPSKRNFAA